MNWKFQQWNLRKINQEKRSGNLKQISMNVINSVVLTASSISSMIPLIGLIIFVGGILVLLVKWVSTTASTFNDHRLSHFYQNKKKPQIKYRQQLAYSRWKKRWKYWRSLWTKKINKNNKSTLAAADHCSNRRQYWARRIFYNLKCTFLCSYVAQPTSLNIISQ